MPGKSKFHPRIDDEDLALVGGGRSKPRSCRFTLGKETRYLLYRRLVGPLCRSGQENLAPTRISPRTVQPVAIRYTEYNIPARNYNY